MPFWDVIEKTHAFLRPYYEITLEISKLNVPFSSLYLILIEIRTLL